MATFADRPDPLGGRQAVDVLRHWRSTDQVLCEHGRRRITLNDVTSEAEVLERIDAAATLCTDECDCDEVEFVWDGTVHSEPQGPVQVTYAHVYPLLRDVPPESDEDRIARQEDEDRARVAEAARMCAALARSTVLDDEASFEVVAAAIAAKSHHEVAHLFLSTAEILTGVLLALADDEASFLHGRDPAAWLEDLAAARLEFPS